MNIMDTIRSRRSIRKFGDASVEDEKIDIILDAGRWAPSGMNNQPWQFIVVKDGETIEEVAGCTTYGDIVRSANLLIAVFLDRDRMYDGTKDTMAIGACIQNMLLAAHSVELGAVWLGEILNRREKVNQILNAPDSLKLMAVIAIGYPVERATSTRKALSEIAHLEQYGHPY
ncbi:MAG: nitroreductase family protein [Methanocellales archaeon]|nr:nitroreductase family protein [Methanocellales archaeon]